LSRAERSGTGSTPPEIGAAAGYAAGRFTDGKFPVIPVEPGTFSILPDNRRFRREKGEANQALAGQFP
jgi:hypothetical protein